MLLIDCCLDGSIVNGYTELAKICANESRMLFMNPWEQQPEATEDLSKRVRKCNKR